MKKTDWVCKDCGAFQKPTKKEGDWEYFNPRCECGGRLIIKLKMEAPHDR